MIKRISFFSLSLLISTNFYASEPQDLSQATIFDEDTNLNPTIPQIQSPASGINQSLLRSTLESRRKAMENSPTHESKPSAIWGVLNYFSDATSTALSTVKYLKGKPENVTDVAHKIEWGINNTLEKIHAIREYNQPTLTEISEPGQKATAEEIQKNQSLIEENRRKSADSLLTILRQQQEHTENLATMIYGAQDNDIKINEDVIAKAYLHLTTARQEALEYQQYALQESKAYLQKDKEFRRDVYAAKLVKEELDAPSDDEYDDVSICRHYLNVSSPNAFIEITKID